MLQSRQNNIDQHIKLTIEDLRVIKSSQLCDELDDCEDDKDDDNILENFIENHEIKNQCDNIDKDTHFDTENEELKKTKIKTKENTKTLLGNPQPLDDDTRSIKCGLEMYEVIPNHWALNTLADFLSIPYASTMDRTDRKNTKTVEISNESIADLKTFRDRKYQILHSTLSELLPLCVFVRPSHSTFQGRKGDTEHKNQSNKYPNYLNSDEIIPLKLFEGEDVEKEVEISKKMDESNIKINTNINTDMTDYSPIISSNYFHCLEVITSSIVEYFNRQESAFIESSNKKIHTQNILRSETVEEHSPHYSAIIKERGVLLRILSVCICSMMDVYLSSSAHSDHSTRTPSSTSSSSFSTTSFTTFPSPSSLSQGSVAHTTLLKILNNLILISPRHISLGRNTWSRVCGTYDFNPHIPDLISDFIAELTEEGNNLSVLREYDDVRTFNSRSKDTRFKDNHFNGLTGCTNSNGTYTSTDYDTSKLLRKRKINSISGSVSDSTSVVYLLPPSDVTSETKPLTADSMSRNQELRSSSTTATVSGVTGSIEVSKSRSVDSSRYADAVSGVSDIDKNELKKYNNRSTTSRENTTNGDILNNNILKNSYENDDEELEILDPVEFLKRFEVKATEQVNTNTKLKNNLEKVENRILEDNLKVVKEGSQCDALSTSQKKVQDDSNVFNVTNSFDIVEVEEKVDKLSRRTKENESKKMAKTDKLKNKVPETFSDFSTDNNRERNVDNSNDNYWSESIPFDLFPTSVPQKYENDFTNFTETAVNPSIERGRGFKINPEPQLRLNSTIEEKSESSIKLENSAKRIEEPVPVPIPSSALSDGWSGTDIGKKFSVSF